MIEANSATGGAGFGTREATRHLRELTELSRAFERRLERELGVNSTDREAMEHLISRGPLSAKDLAAAISHSPAGTTTVIDRLEKLGHASRVADPSDRRVTLVQATPASKRKAETIVWGMVAAVDSVAASLSEDEAEVVSRYLAGVTRAYRTFSGVSDPE